jgi:hypothetical protein
MKKLSITLVLSMVLPLFAGAYSTIVNDDFSSGVRNVQSLPNQMAWYKDNSSGTSLTVSDGAMTQTAGTSAGMSLAHFGTNATGTIPVNLAVGDQLTVAFSFTFDGTSFGTSWNSGTALRVGLFDSGGSRISEDGFSGSSSAFSGYDGYMLAMGSSGTRLYDRTGTGALLSALGEYTTLLNETDVGGALITTGTLYSGTFTVARSDADQLDLIFSLTGGPGAHTISHSVAADITTSFDTLAFRIGGNVVDSMSFESFHIEYSAIPEPRSSVFLMGCAGLLVVFRCARRSEKA